MLCAHWCHTGQEVTRQATIWIGRRQLRGGGGRARPHGRDLPAERQPELLTHVISVLVMF